MNFWLSKSNFCFWPTTPECISLLQHNSIWLLALISLLVIEEIEEENWTSITGEVRLFKHLRVVINVVLLHYIVWPLWSENTLCHPTNSNKLHQSLVNAFAVSLLRPFPHKNSESTSTYIPVHLKYLFRFIRFAILICEPFRICKSTGICD